MQPLPDRRWMDPSDFRDIRRISGLTQKDLAAILDVSVRQVQRWEAGSSRITGPAIFAMRVIFERGLNGRDIVTGRPLRSFDYSPAASYGPPPA